MGGIRLKVLGVCAILAAAVCAQNTGARAADELVKFDSAPYIVGQIQQRRAIERGEMAVATTGAIESVKALWRWSVSGGYLPSWL
jgi:hypothetical protein